MAKTTYVAPVVVVKAKLNSGDQTLTIVASEGKTGFNVKASLKTGDEEAQTGCREKFETEAAARAAVKKLVGEAKARGWKEVAIAQKNAFTSIPAPAKAA